MISSRNLDDLLPPVKAKALALIEACKTVGIDLLITSTYRDLEAQSALYSQGRTAPGKVVTNARAGQSFHNYRVAFDVVPLRDGKPVWGASGADGDLWVAIGKLGEAQGMDWAGRWTHFRELPHFQFTGGLTLDDFRAGHTLAADVSMPAFLRKQAP